MKTPSILWPEEREYLTQISNIKFSLLFSILMIAMGLIIFYDLKAIFTQAFQTLPASASLSLINSLNTLTPLMSFTMVGMGGGLFFFSILLLRIYRREYHEISTERHNITIALENWP